MTQLSPAAKAVLDAAVVVSWDWSNLEPASSSVIAAATLRAVVNELKCFGITEKNILAIADELKAL
jgi:hypothetical protein